jgi:hypothetical protein
VALAGGVAAAPRASLRVIIWLGPAAEFCAYGRLPGARRDTALIVSTPARLAALIGQAEQAARHAIANPKDPHERRHC